MEKLINKQSVLEVAKGFTFTFAEERQRYMDFMEYCLDNANDNSKHLTNADRIRSMTDAELAEIMDSDCYKLMCFKRGCPHKPNNGVTCKECYLKWLKSEVGCEQ